MPIKKDYRSVVRDTAMHRSLGLAAARQATSVLSMFEKEHPDDDRPRRAIEAIRAWSQGRLVLGMKEVRRLSLDSHAAARKAETDAARFAARAAGQAVAAWHVPNHALAVPYYVRKAKMAMKDALFPKVPAPAQRALQNAGIKTMKDLSKWSERELLELHGMGQSAFPKLRKALKEKGLSFKK